MAYSDFGTGRQIGLFCQLNAICSNHGGAGRPHATLPLVSNDPATKSSTATCNASLNYIGSEYRTYLPMRGLWN